MNDAGSKLRYLSRRRGACPPKEDPKRLKGEGPRVPTSYKQPCRPFYALTAAEIRDGARSASSSSGDGVVKQAADSEEKLLWAPFEEEWRIFSGELERRGLLFSPDYPPAYANEEGKNVLPTFQVRATFRRKSHRYVRLHLAYSTPTPS